MSAPTSKVEAALVPLFAALGDPTRLSLVIKLSSGDDRSIAKLALGTGLSRQAVTKHLRVLEQAGLIDETRVGRESRFTLVPDRLADAGRYLDEVAAQWEEALARIKAHVES
ncbi:MAG: helix-turn-helix transcriptional regulator [Sphingomonas sp.]|uniref:ArsR/SmtB family transcription factor n=1 Tax=Sphingomonas sp. TaxID=28214 RepID=UPI0017A06D0B|nr:metalloregulator ArsR/SmtB family transcription factor [Sphingomonas sp.]MBA3668191.1 helix-turn-helix transcriptional regulator [Sphingomonas sp.]